MLHILNVVGKDPNKGFLQAFDSDFNKVELSDEHIGEIVQIIDVNLFTREVLIPGRTSVTVLKAIDADHRKCTFVTTY